MPRPVHGHRRFVSIAAAAEYLDVDPKTVRRMISRGDLAGFRVGGKSIRVDLDQVDAALQPIPAAGGAA